MLNHTMHNVFKHDTLTLSLYFIIFSMLKIIVFLLYYVSKFKPKGVERVLSFTVNWPRMTNVLSSFVNSPKFWKHPAAPFGLSLILQYFRLLLLSALFGDSIDLGFYLNKLIDFLRSISDLKGSGSLFRICFSLRSLAYV